MFALKKYSKIVFLLTIVVILSLQIPVNVYAQPKEAEIEGDFFDDNIQSEMNKKRREEEQRKKEEEERRRKEKEELENIKNQTKKDDKNQKTIFSEGMGFNVYLSPLVSTTTAHLYDLNKSILINNDYSFSVSFGAAYEVGFTFLGQSGFLAGVRTLFEPYWNNFELRESPSLYADAHTKYYKNFGMRYVLDTYFFESTKGASLGANVGYIAYVPIEVSTKILDGPYVDRSGYVESFKSGIRLGLSFAYFMKMGLSVGLSLNWDIMFGGIEKNEVNKTRVDSNQYHVFANYRFYNFKK